MKKNFWKFLVGSPRNPLQKETWQRVALIAFFAWIGLGSDGLSSANYGPEEAFRALGHFPMLGFYLAIATAITVFIISLAYNQVIELFPNGGGGYKVANQLIHPWAGLVSGAALIIDYVLTIAISISAAVDAIFSLLPTHFLHMKLFVIITLICILTLLNLRGAKESIKILLPIFLGFVLTHLILIIYGILHHVSEIHLIFRNTFSQTKSIVHTFGTTFMLITLLKAYSLGSGTYTGLEAVSNNVNILAEPRVRTGKWTMFYMALSLSITAGGIIFLYMLWHVTDVHGKTYNAVLFSEILTNIHYGNLLLIVVLAFEAGILLLGSNTGFLGGPAVLANMAVDHWVPNQFANLSSRLVKQNGIIFFGLAAIVITLVTDGKVGFLVVLYSINVFLTFALTLFGLCKHWWEEKHRAVRWKSKILLSLIGFIICAGILLALVIMKFGEGAWLTILVTALLIAGCNYVRRYYENIQKSILKMEEAILPKTMMVPDQPPIPNSTLPTAAVFVQGKGVGLHTFLWINRLFPQQYKNFIFVQVGNVDVRSFGGESVLHEMQKEVNENLKFFVDYANSLGFPARAYAGFDTNPILKLEELAEEIQKDFPHVVFFSGKIIYENDNLLTRMLHKDTPTALQQKLHFKGIQMVVLPMKLQVPTNKKLQYT